MEKVQILLATYNGEAYIKEMVESLLGQSYENIEIILSDDNSSDGTVALLEEYAEKHPDKIKHHISGKRFGNAQAHFLHLLSTFGDAPYVMFCDQDDVWKKDKIEKTMAKMKETERDGLPCLVHTDLNVVDGELNPINQSFCKYSGIDGYRLSLNHILVHNVVTGCTVLINHALASLVKDREFNSDYVVMHDWWMAILASVFGTSAFLDEATILYRQHGNNTVGAKDVRSAAFLLDWMKNRKMKKSMNRCILQAKEFLRCYNDILPVPAKVVLEDFASLENKNIFARDRVYLKHKINKFGFTRVVAQYLGL